MESKEDVEVLSRAIEKLLDEKRKREAAGDAFIEDDDDQLLLSRIFSQMKKTEGATKEEEESPDSKGKNKDQEDQDQRHLEVSLEEIAKDIRKVKRQNTVTHLLLSAMIILTLTWQLSEFSMVFMMKERLSHPIKSLGGMFSGLLKGKIRPIKNQLPGTSASKGQNNLISGNETAHLQMPELLREFGFNDHDDE